MATICAHCVNAIKENRPDEWKCMPTKFIDENLVTGECSVGYLLCSYVNDGNCHMFRERVLSYED